MTTYIVHTHSCSDRYVCILLRSYISLTS